MKEEGNTRHDLGREVFLDRVQQFAAKSHDIIVNQAKKMGASLDWSREAYTLDAPRSLAVRTAFKRMYDDGLIYRGNRVINWCSRCQSTLADDEVDYKETKAKFYYLQILLGKNLMLNGSKEQSVHA
jgi:valyl-tRNA synthetase